MGRLAADSWSLGEIALLFSMTRPTLAAKTVPFTGHAPWIVWICLAVYTGGGVFSSGSRFGAPPAESDGIERETLCSRKEKRGGDGTCRLLSHPPLAEGCIAAMLMATRGRSNQS